MGTPRFLLAPDLSSAVIFSFAMRIMMVIASVGSYFVNEAIAKAKYGQADKMDFEHPLTSLVWLAGPISGLVAQPVIGEIVHACRACV